VATSLTTSPTKLTIAAPSAQLGSTASVTVTATSAVGIPTGNVLLSVDNGAPLTAALTQTGVATFSLNGLSAGSHSLNATYALTSVFQSGSATGSLTILSGPIATISPSSLDFGTLYLGGIAEKSVTVTNSGTSALTISDPFLFDVGNGDSQEFIALNLCPKSLGVGKSCTIYIVFLAGPSYSQQTAMLKVVDNAPGSPQTVNLTATVINPQASFSPNAVKFGTVRVGTPSQASVVLTSSGATPLSSLGISVTGGLPGEFTESSGCPTSLTVGAKCTILVTFTPGRTGSRSAYLNVVDNVNGGPQQVLLSGTGN
jgi:Bacterial Ig-like domain (group 3)/Abnormal spindle-like microcephaly-assoc'd, ASPM-SPD-2-Hydin